LIRRLITAKLVLVDAPEASNASNGSCGRCEILEAEHRPSSGLDAAMALLDEVVQILRKPQLVRLGTSDRVRRAALAPERLLEECFGCGHIAPSAESKVDGLASLVHGAIKIDPLAAYLEVGLPS
jgi:hypothetical protein